MNTNKIIERVNELYVLYRKKFLILDSNCNYKTITYTNENKVNLCDAYIKNHLHNKNTIGVFAGSVFTKFVCFDVDVENKDLAKMTVYKLVYTLQELGIPDDYIYISDSGSKGYHVEIFFDNPIQNTVVKQFYLFVLNLAELLNIKYGKVELRPTDSQGVKIPLGTHFKTGRTCWYVDYESGLKPIENYDYLLTIRQLDSEYFYALINKYEDRIDLSEAQVSEFEQVISNHKPLEIYKQNIDEDVTIEAIQNLIENGLRLKGTRHNSLLKIAKYNKHVGMSDLENKDFLINWLKQQDEQTYTTSWEDCLKDIDLIVKWVYENNCSLTVRQENINISKEEIEEILKVKGKNEKVVLYTLLVHSKRYGLNNGTFYMSYKQMNEATGLNKDTLIQKIKVLESNSIISVTRDSSIEYDIKSKKPLSKVNRYKINLLCRKLYNPENVNNFIVCEKNCNNCFIACAYSLCGTKHLRKHLSRREYESVISDVNNLPCVISG